MNANIELNRLQAEEDTRREIELLEHELHRPAQPTNEDAFSLLKDAVASGRHEENCAFHIFRAHHRWAPVQHPLWKTAPKCDCWFAKAADLVNRHNINVRQNG